MNISFEEIVEDLMRKGESSAHNTDLILQFYNDTIKKLEIDKLEYEKTRSESGFSLTGEEEQLFKLLKEGPASKILPQLVFRVAKLLKKEPSNTNKVDEKLKQFVDEEMLKIEKVLE